MESLIHIISTLNSIKEDYDKLQEENKLLKKEIETLKLTNKPVVDKLIQIKGPSVDIYNETTHTIETISQDEAYKYGTGVIRYKLDTRYYHGLGHLEEISSSYSWYDRTNHLHLIIEYKEGRKLPHIKWDTYNASTFCKNCSYIAEQSKRKRIRSHYRCNGHLIT
jgi:hypothetical protein